MSNGECWKITGIQLKFLSLIKLIKKLDATLSPESLENVSNFAYEKKYICFHIFHIIQRILYNTSI